MIRRNAARDGITILVLCTVRREQQGLFSKLRITSREIVPGARISPFFLHASEVPTTVPRCFRLLSWQQERMAPGRETGTISREVGFLFRTASTQAQRGKGWLLQHMRYTAGISGFFATQARATRRAAEQARPWWKTGAAYEWPYRVRMFILRSKIVSADSIACIRLSTTRFVFCSARQDGGP